MNEKGGPLDLLGQDNIKEYKEVREILEKYPKSSGRLQNLYFD